MGDSVFRSCGAINISPGRADAGKDARALSRHPTYFLIALSKVGY
jgi:hypothetical protein